MALTDDFDVPALRKAHLEIKELEKAAIERARLHLRLEGKPYENFKNENGFTVSVQLDTLLDSNFVDMTFYQRDAQGGGDTHIITIPRSIILGPPTEKEADFAEYERLKAQFEK